MVLKSEDAPQWIKGESLRKKWAQLNNTRLRVWMPCEAPAWISARWKREEWAQEMNDIEESDLTYLIPCVCDKCGTEFVGIDPGMGGFIYMAYDREMSIVGVRRYATHFETDCVLCVSCHDKLRVALQDFEKSWVGKDGE